MAIESEIYGLNSSPTEQQPFYLDMLESIPSVATTMGWNIGRTSRTMTSPRAKTLLPRRSASGGLARRELSGMGHRQAITQTLNPRRFGRLSRAANIDPSYYGKKSHIYTPFNALSSAGNFLFKQRGAEGAAGLRGQASGYVHKATGSISRQLSADGTVPFSPGTLGRIAGMSKIAGMSEAKFASKAGYMSSAVRDLNPLAKPFTSQTFLGAKYTMGSQFGNTITGSFSGKAAGYIHGASAARAGGEALSSAYGASTGVFREGVTAGSKAFVQGSRLAKMAPYAGPALRAFSVAANIMLVHDLAELAGKAVGGIVKTGIQAVDSAKGSIDKPIMGMGFKDNSVAATSRQRGVLAIQNSQLNARSVLGSEAGMMAAHFG